MELLTYNVATSYPSLPFRGKTIINTLNPHSYCISKKESAFEEALRASDVLLPDGIGVVWAAKMLNGHNIPKIAGFDIFIFLMRHLNEIQGSCFFLGASEETLTLIKAKAAKEYPMVKIGLYSPPFKAQFSFEDNRIMCDQVSGYRPTVLFVGLTAPKQEKWVHAHKNELDAQIICSIGAVFDFYAGTVKRSGPFWIKLGLEWLPRFLKDPKRLAGRNLVSTPKFILEVLSFKLLGRGFL